MCCLLLACHTNLPRTWRNEEVRVREYLASIEYPLLSEDRLNARLVDDIFQELWRVVPHIIDTLAAIPQLKTLNGDTRANVIDQLETNLLHVRRTLEDLIMSSRFTKLVETIETGFPWLSRHSECCPDLPFPPFRFLFPQAGTLRLSVLSLRNYLRVILYGPIRASGVVIEELELDCKFTEDYAYEICRSFAAIEDEFGEDMAPLMSCFYTLVMAGFTCPEELRMWLWHKLAHFEEYGLRHMDMVKKNLSVVWGMPELLTQSFNSWKQRPLENRVEVLNADVIDDAAKIMAIVDEPEPIDVNDDDYI